jgi:hypothetical protein
MRAEGMGKLVSNWLHGRLLLWNPGGAAIVGDEQVLCSRASSVSQACSISGMFSFLGCRMQFQMERAHHKSFSHNI